MAFENKVKAYCCLRSSKRLVYREVPIYIRYLYYYNQRQIQDIYREYAI
jgi:hypothetical protein